MKKSNKDIWIPHNLKRGGLSHQLRIPIKENIPILLLHKIKAAKIDEYITNPTPIGKRVIKVTRLLKRRATLALTLKEMN